jgi:nucleoside-diphosphate-sugar epimerase
MAPGTLVVVRWVGGRGEGRIRKRLFKGRFRAGVRPFPRGRMREEVEKYTLGDGTKAAELLGWRAETGLEEGVRAIVASGALGGR